MRRISTQLIFLGCVYLILGATALAFASAATLASVMVLGVVLFCVGVAQIVYGIQGRKDGQLWPHLGLGCLALVCAALIARNPIENTLGLTLAVSFLLIASGLTKFIGAVTERALGWGWFAGSGLISLLLGGLILATFPVSAFWTIGTLVGVDLVAAGIATMGLGISIKEVREDLREAGYNSSKMTKVDRRHYERDRDEDSRTPPLH
ncbi:HdeD family acid-resistance protein [Bdellovibrio bacteriovorus]|uniref:HdeD family acid-resistance protein n=1 Tax=Bdellovibrio bacteriovorus TaxID=959 RepID=UPI003AA803CE